MRYTSWKIAIKSTMKKNWNDAMGIFSWMREVVWYTFEHQGITKHEDMRCFKR